MKRTLTIFFTAAMLALGVSGIASAQYQWRDDRGQMVYSDLAPPASIRPDQIIRVPDVRKPVLLKAAAGVGTGAGATAAGIAGASAATGARPEAPLSAAEREMAFRKRLADQIETQKKAQAEQLAKAQTERACSDARSDMRLFESGQRVSRVNAKGENEFIADAERAERLSSVRKTIAERC